MWHTPQWLLNLLIEQLPAIEAREQLSAINVELTPHMKVQHRKRMLRRLERTARRTRLRPQPQPILEHNPEKAAAWFAEQGMEVVQSA